MTLYRCSGFHDDPNPGFRSRQRPGLAGHPRGHSCSSPPGLMATSDMGKWWGDEAVLLDAPAASDQLLDGQREVVEAQDRKDTTEEAQAKPEALQEGRLVLAG
jgi:hypothetical protein